MKKQKKKPGKCGGFFFSLPFKLPPSKTVCNARVRYAPPRKIVPILLQYNTRSGRPTITVIIDSARRLVGKNEQSPRLSTDTPRVKNGREKKNLFVRGGKSACAARTVRNRRESGAIGKIISSALAPETHATRRVSHTRPWVVFDWNSYANLRMESIEPADVWRTNFFIFLQNEIISLAVAAADGTFSDRYLISRWNASNNRSGHTVNWNNPRSTTRLFCPLTPRSVCENPVPPPKFLSILLLLSIITNFFFHFLVSGHSVRDFYWTVITAAPPPPSVRQYL